MLKVQVEAMLAELSRRGPNFAPDAAAGILSAIQPTNHCSMGVLHAHIRAKNWLFQLLSTEWTLTLPELAQRLGALAAVSPAVAAELGALASRLAELVPSPAADPEAHARSVLAALGQRGEGYAQAAALSLMDVLLPSAYNNPGADYYRQRGVAYLAPMLAADPSVTLEGLAQRVLTLVADQPQLRDVLGCIAGRLSALVPQAASARQAAQGAARHFVVEPYIYHFDEMLPPDEGQQPAGWQVQVCPQPPRGKWVDVTDNPRWLANCASQQIADTLVTALRAAEPLPAATLERTSTNG